MTYISPSLRAAHTAHVPEPTTEQLYHASRAAIARSIDYERARELAASLPSEDRLALAIWLVDHAEGLDPDARNEAVDVLGGLL